MQELEKKIRDIMLDAEEPVPSRIWDGVATRLDGAAPPRAVLPFWRRAVRIAVPVAAAVALGVFFALPQKEIPLAGSGERQPIAVAAPSVTEPSLTVPGTLLPIGVRTAWMPSETRPMPAEQNTAASEEKVPSSVPASSAAPSGAGRQDVSGAEADGSNDTAALNALAFAQKRNAAGRVSAYAGGDVMTNAHPSASTSRHMRASAVPQTGITEGTNRYYGIPFSLGAGIRYRFAPGWSLTTGLVYTNLSRSFTGKYTEIEGGKELRSFSGDIDNIQHYLGVPFNVNYHFLETPSVSCYAFAGGTAERCIADKYRILSADKLIWSKKPSGMQFSAALGFGVQFALSGRVGLYLDPSIRYWFNCGQSKSIRTQQPLMLGLEAGLRFDL